MSMPATALPAATATSVIAEVPPIPLERKVGLALRKLETLSKELWLILSLFAIGGLLNFMVTPRLILSFYALPTIVSAYLYGRRHATLTAFFSVLLVILLTQANAAMSHIQPAVVPLQQWIDVTIWGGVLMIAAYLMGSLYEHKTAQLTELRETYQGLLMILRHFISNDKYTENHSYRVSVYATRIAAELRLDAARIEDIRAAAILHDIGKLDISRELLYKASQLTPQEFAQIQTHTDRSVALLEPVGGTLRRVIPIVLAHHDRFDGSGYHGLQGSGIPIESRIIMVADVYDALSSDRPYRKAMSPFEAKEIVEKGSGTEFDPVVVDAFVAAFRRGALEVPTVVV
jgi:HD-GYP domain-containing protein (c-di-GMP phosphodiesterase class II)